MTSDIAPIRFGSVCSGIEAASVAMEPFGWQAAWLAEIEAFPSAVLAHHWPDVPNLGDMTTIAPRILSGELEAPDVLVGGTPCQAFSIAGLRGGMSDHRGQLTLSYVELANAIDSRRSVLGQQPCVTWWENVPGVLSARDNSFGCFLGALAGEDCELQPAGGKWTDAGCVFGPQRAVAWRIIDAQYVGLAQRRRRVFVVSSARDGLNPAEILFEFEGVRRDTAPSREAPSSVAGTLDASLGRGRGAGTSVAALTAFSGSGSFRLHIDEHISATLQTSCDRVSGSAPCVCFPLDLRNATRDPEKLDHQNRQGVGVGSDSDPCPTLSTMHVPGVATFCSQHEINRTVAALTACGVGTCGVGTCGADDNQAQAGHILPAAFRMVAFGEYSDDGTASTMKARDYKDHTDLAVISVHGTQDPDVSIERAHTLGRNSGQENAICITGDITHTLKGEGFDASEDGTGRGQPIVPAYGIPGNWIGRAPENGGNATEPHLDRSPCLTAADRHGVAHAMAVRRLTPTECERLQGFPDGHTLAPYRNKPAADGPRYKALGNSMAVNVMRWIGRRIDAHLRGLPSVDIDARSEPETEEQPMSEPATPEQFRTMMVEHIDRMVKYWAELPGLSVEDRCDGVAFSVLTMLDGASEVPGVTLVGHTEAGQPIIINGDCDMHDVYADLRRQKGN